MADSVTARLYCHGLGDCNLLGFPGEEGTTRWMLIDCGIHTSARGGKERIRQVVEDIAQATGGRIAVVVGTHEHWDHLSGFVQAADLFARITVDEVWLGWTENPADPQARALDRFKNEATAIVGAAAAALDGRERDAASARGLDSLLGFTFGMAGERSREAREALRALAPVVRYLEPGETLPVAPGFRAHVLGPPRDAKLLGLKDSLGRTYAMGEGALGDGVSAATAALRNALRIAEGDLDVRDDPFAPFDRSAGQPLSASLAMKAEGAWGADADLAFLSRHYAGPATEGPADQAWRRIDSDWVEVASDIALQLDSRTNNTSLVLGIEVEATSRVLLFAADAQVGNWSSWKDVRFGDGTGGGTTGADLLARTVFYKVGHHGSRNATLKEGGLELMTSPDLTSFIPTDAVMARKVGWSDIPAGKLMDRLREKGSGRVISSDDAWLQQPGLPAGCEPGGSLKRIIEVEPGLYLEAEIG